MSAIAPLSSQILPGTSAMRPDALRERSPIGPAGLPDGIRLAPSAPQGGFGAMLDGLVNHVEAKQTEANALTQRVLLGDSDQLHQSVIAMQEASVAFSLMVEVRNKLVESYQELMRLQV